jgi:hypothetical protein
VNSEARRAWTREAAEHLAPRYTPGAGILTSFGDLTGIFREAGIPLRETFTGDNGLPFEALLRRPDLHLRHQWAVVMAATPSRPLSGRAKVRSPLPAGEDDRGEGRARHRDLPALSGQASGVRPCRIYPADCCGNMGEMPGRLIGARRNRDRPAAGLVRR